MKAFVIVGVIIILTFVIFIWTIRLLKPDKKKLKVVHRLDQDATLFV